MIAEVILMTVLSLSCSVHHSKMSWSLLHGLLSSGNSHFKLLHSHDRRSGDSSQQTTFLLLVRWSIVVTLSELWSQFSVLCTRGNVASVAFAAVGRLF